MVLPNGMKRSEDLTSGSSRGLAFWCFPRRNIHKRIMRTEREKRGRMAHELSRSEDALYSAMMNDLEKGIHSSNENIIPSSSLLTYMGAESHGPNQIHQPADPSPELIEHGPHRQESGWKFAIQTLQKAQRSDSATGWDRVVPGMIPFGSFVSLKHVQENGGQETGGS